MPCHETKYCQRCNGPFECKVGNISQCQCNGIELAPEARQEIAASYSECLCRQCLLNIQQEVLNKARKEKFLRLFSFFRSR
ncbi:cysteine-rich CWC family protein [uncultured Chitinophaga sp.]|uniref:cysteine-rich CWC family protein n=1 Tax=uncultured Chitinophaga sp. TaxID=339340 RepID=UPI0025E955F6|nr:cysteine-rich CWC family protein [uncultured Chitinophaga sp.]